MAVISTFFGIIISMCFFDDRRDYPVKQAQTCRGMGRDP